MPTVRLKTNVECAARVESCEGVAQELVIGVAAIRFRLDRLQQRVSHLHNDTASTSSSLPALEPARPPQPTSAQAQVPLAPAPTPTPPAPAPAPAPASAPASATGTKGKDAPPSVAVRIVAQRCDAAELLVDNVNEWVRVGWGLVYYVSFGDGCQADALPKVVRSLLNIPLLTAGVWGDGSSTTSIVTAARAAAATNPHDEAVAAASEGAAVATRGAPAVVIIPAAGLISKVKGKCLQYRGQCDKSDSQQLYSTFVELMRSEAEKQIGPGGGIGAGAKHGTKKKKKVADGNSVLCAPALYFTSGDNFGKYAAYDGDGFPTVAGDGSALSKSMRKKLEKALTQHTKKYEAQQAKGGHAAPAAPTAPTAPVPAGQPASAAAAGQPASDVPMLANDNAAGGLQPELRVVCGTFGNRQGLRLTADMGPFTHTFDY